MGKTRNVVFVGPAASGKDCLIMKLINPGIDLKENYRPTIGADQQLYSKEDILFWSVSGQEKYRRLTYMYTRTADLFVLCVDLSSEFNKDEIKSIMAEAMTKHVNMPPIVLALTKSDAERVVTDEQINALESKYTFTKIVTVSAKDNTGLDDLWDALRPSVESTNEQSREIKEEHPLDKVLHSLNKSSRMYCAVNLLKDCLKSLDTVTSNRVYADFCTFYTQLTTTIDNKERVKIINAFEKQATDHLGGSYPKIHAAIVGVCIAAVVTIIAVAVGFGIGFAAGAWTGPGAFISGVLCGSAAAGAVVGVSAALGVGAGFFAAHTTHKTAIKENAPIYRVADAARFEYLSKVKF